MRRGGTPTALASRCWEMPLDFGIQRNQDVVKFLADKRSRSDHERTVTAVGLRKSCDRRTDSSKAS